MIALYALICSMFQDKPLRAYTPFMQVLILFSFCLTFLSVFALMGLMLIDPLFGLGGIEELSGGIPAIPENRQALRFFQAMASTGMFVAPGICFMYYYNEERIGGFFQKSALSGWMALLPYLLPVLALPVVSYLYELNQAIVFPEAISMLEQKFKAAEQLAEQQTKLLLNMEQPQELLVCLMVMAFIPAIGEEMIFRAGLQRILQQGTGNVHLAIWLSAAIFSALHLQFYGFLPRMILGVMLGYLFASSGNLCWSITAHFLNNAAAILMYYFYQHKFLAITEEDLAQGPWYLYGLATIGLVVMMNAMWRNRREPQYLD